ncbi:MEMBRANE-ANCHORED UBIQUITIN-FOLD PROTEIN 2 [Salix koriyanagi]|uniref:MEMBRANE-ANCHORED UBIQUITIN-FOLD PROTEIN 2 n=1 Tax=Salix koriyanagi TaxID=2511006 RepID=A0A9Q0VT53_9ROSI|nr:MEMBRANE-ANCHORED UBIQUITIN-FOLD PROTEIN 2 [Salix koriyanagi]
MAGVQDQLEIKFRLTDGSDIGPKTFPAATTVATLKENILAQWPKAIFCREREERGKSSKAKQMRLCYIIICTSKSRNDKGREFGAGIR